MIDLIDLTEITRKSTSSVHIHFSKHTGETFFTVVEFPQKMALELLVLSHRNWSRLAHGTSAFMSLV